MGHRTQKKGEVLSTGKMYSQKSWAIYLWGKQEAGCGLWLQSAEGRACAATDHPAGSEGVGRALQDGLQLTCPVVSVRLCSVPMQDTARIILMVSLPQLTVSAPVPLSAPIMKGSELNILSLMFPHIPPGRRDSSCPSCCKMGKSGEGVYNLRFWEYLHTYCGIW